jgi:hypothetical protein
MYGFDELVLHHAHTILKYIAMVICIGRCFVIRHAASSVVLLVASSSPLLVMSIHWKYFDSRVDVNIIGMLSSVNDANNDLTESKYTEDLLDDLICVVYIAIWILILSQ